MRRRTDYGTVVLHAILVVAFGVALLTGLRIATEAPDRDWINLVDAVLPRAHVWTAHMQAATALVAVSVAYAFYLVRAGLGRRVRFDRIRLRGLFGRGQARLSALNVLLYWIFFAAMLALLMTGGLIYFGLAAGHDAGLVHWIATWTVLGFIALHVFMHYLIGGIMQLLRIVRPAALAPPPPSLDPVELLTLLARQRRQPPARKPLPRSAAAPAAPVERLDEFRVRSRKSGPTLQANPLLAAAAIAFAGTALMVAMERNTTDTLKVHRIAAAQAPVLDGDTSDPVWHGVRPFAVLTARGGNFDGKGDTRVEVRAVHDGTWAYFLFVWEDPTRSLKQLPLVKTGDGWALLHDGYENGDERKYNEDKFSVLLTTLDVTLAGDRTFHASSHPLPDAPSTMTGRGLHYTPASDIYVDVWQWKATGAASTGRLDDSHFGPPAPAEAAQAAGGAPYRGGFAADPGEAGYADNFVQDSQAARDFRRITPRRLPRDLTATVAAMGPIDLDPDHSDGEQARWFMAEEESVPYSADADARIPVGTVIPGVIHKGEPSGDRADVRCAARWASGRWALEVARRLDTHSKYDVAIRNGVFMRVAAFDHTQIQHTRHVRPIQLEVE